MEEENVIKNIIQIRNIQGITKREVARGLGIDEASYGRIESGKIALSYNRLASIASVLGVTVIDILSYPDVYVKKAREEEPVEAVLQIKLKNDKKDSVLKLVFGEHNLEILSK